MTKHEIENVEETINTLMRIQKEETAKTILTRLWSVLIKDGEQFVAGEIKKIAEENGITL